ncbi:hypothetical protein AWZ03_006619 [Drosophila navojoa]|uniref:Uncharacterized protein n=1 Tax=Drosophila navojoa TaxID=7232 RepID=A0A484BGJ3_DRONA|nr:hypothetical protein AWZ03_006619 [Drosophila navojoa]
MREHLSSSSRKQEKQQQEPGAEAILIGIKKRLAAVALASRLKVAQKLPPLWQQAPRSWQQQQEEQEEQGLPQQRQPGGTQHQLQQ